MPTLSPPQDAPSGCGPTADAWCGRMESDQTTMAKRAYYANIAFVDEKVGQVLQALASSPDASGEEGGGSMLDNSLVLWLSDHGDGQSDHWHWRKGCVCLPVFLARARPDRPALPY